MEQLVVKYLLSYHEDISLNAHNTSLVSGLVTQLRSIHTFGCQDDIFMDGQYLKANLLARELPLKKLIICKFLNNVTTLHYIIYF